MYLFICYVITWKYSQEGRNNFIVIIYFGKHSNATKNIFAFGLYSTLSILFQVQTFNMLRKKLEYPYPLLYKM